ncbi:MAG TPA: hypothetical protein VFB19_12375 [Mycobacterium sp.]|nr:hypothetical protein [Mycobacterium sp.]
MAKKVFTSLGIAVLGAMAVLTIAFGTGQQARADNKFGGAGQTVTQTGAPLTIETVSASPTVKATPYAG